MLAFIKNFFSTVHFATVLTWLAIAFVLLPFLAFFAFLQGQLVIAVSYGLSFLTTEGITSVIILLITIYEGMWIYVLIAHGFGLSKN